MKKLCERAVVKPFGFHSIGHLSASILFKLGYDVGIIKSILRHKSPNTTERSLKRTVLERVREVLEELILADAKVSVFKSPPDGNSKADQKKEKAVYGAVNSPSAIGRSASK